MIRTKTCTECQKTKALSMFHVQSKKADGTRQYRGKCKACNPRAYKTKTKTQAERALARELGRRICVPVWLTRSIIGEHHWDWKYYA